MFEIGGREGRVRAKEAKDQLGNETKRGGKLLKEGIEAST